jgi:hypothetical protein
VRGGSQIDIAKEVLNVYKNTGLWETSTDKHGNITVSKNKISESQYKNALEKLNTLTENGFNDKDYQKLLND